MRRAYLLSHLLEAAVARHPHRPMLDEGGVLTSYAEFGEEVLRLAQALSQAGITYQDRVGIYLPKERAAYAAIFAALACGCSYVPLDPSAPPGRICSLIDDCGMSALITSEELAARLYGGDPTPHAPRLLVVTGALPSQLPGGLRVIAWEDAQAVAALPPPNPAIENDLAYILYTSGSTGRPKGVMISHRGALAFIEWAASAVGLVAEDRVAAVAALHFDLSIFDLFAAVAVGATVCPLPPGALLRPKQVVDWIARARISVLYSTPSTFILLLESGGLGERALPELRRILFAGEVFPTQHLRRLRAALPGAEFYNLYGPTETNVCTWKRIDALPADDRTSVSIGRACANTEVVCLDAAGRETAVGEEGELWVRGPTLLRGYWNRPEATAAALQVLPNRGPVPDVWYRTGDLVHRDATGDYHFHGRRDHMVKIRGYRVELGEVEAALHVHPNIREAAVVAVPAEPHGLKLRAFIVPRDAERHSTIQLKTHLGQALPAYMIPAEICCLEELPKTSTGKIDRQALAQVG